MDSKSATLWAQYYTSLDRMQFEQETYKILCKTFEKFPLASFVFTLEKPRDIGSVSTMCFTRLQEFSIDKSTNYEYLTRCIISFQNTTVKTTKDYTEVLTWQPS